MTFILYEIGFWVLAFAAGALAGSFLNVIIHRGPALWGLVDAPDGGFGNFLGPRSYCPHCRAPINYVLLVPIVSYVVLRGHCAECGEQIPARYPLVEVAAALHAVIVVALFGLTGMAAFAALFGWVLLALAVIDWETGYLPDWMTGALALGGLSANALSMFSPPIDALIGAAAGVFIFWAIGAAWRRWRSVDALGLGDAKLLGALGAWMGWEALPVIVLAGSLASLAGVGLSNLRGSSIGASDAIPFGPGLAFGGYIVFLIMQISA